MNTKRFYALLLTLTLLLALLPTHTAKAYTSGQTCPSCGSGMLIAIVTTSEKHALSCSQTGCIHSTSDGYIWENHHGGNACTGTPICEVCGKEYGGALGHDWETGWTNGGDTHYHACTRCLERKDEATHSGGTATCTEKAKCAICGAEYGEPDTENGHDWSAWDRYWEGVLDSTYHHRKCLRDGCGATEAEAHHLDMYQDASPEHHDLICRVCSKGGFAYTNESHSFSNWKDNGDGTCTCTCVCKRQKTEAHDFSVDVPAKEATCTEPGLTEGKHCTRCGEKVEQETVPAKGHTEVVDKAVEPTCTGTGLTEGKHCSACGEILTKQEEVAALGHTWDVAPAVAPTCTKTGLTEGKRCTRCGETVAQTEVPALGHDWVLTGRTITRLQLVCRTCWTSAWQHNWNSRNLLPGLVRDEQGEAADYAAHISFIQAKRVMTLVPAGGEDEPVFLYLTAENVAEWVQEGLDAVIFRRGKSQLRIELKELSPDWFPLEAGQVPEGYAFHLQPQDGGWLVKAEALVGEKRIEARSLSGVTLTQGCASVDVPENGVYRFDG